MPGYAPSARHRGAALLLAPRALGAAPGAAPGASPKSEGRSREEAALASSKVIGERLSRTLAHGQETLRRMQALRGALPRSKDLRKDSETFSALLAAAKQDARVLKDLSDQYYGLLNSVRGMSAVHAMKLYSRSMTDGKQDRAPAFVGRAMDYELEVVRFLRLEQQFSSDVADEEKAFGPALSAEQDDRVEGRFVAQAVACAGLVVAAGLATLGVVLLRRRRRGSSPAPGPLAPALPGMPAVLDGHLKVLRMIGKGGMGEVYEAEDTELRRRVAVKRMRDELLASPGDLERFLREARLVASLRHPNVVGIYSIVREGGRVYLVFEHVPGGTLRRLLGSRGRLAADEACRVLRGMAAAVDYAHSMRVVHRDLKPGNVMLTPDGTVKVMDFGIAYEAKATVARLTRGGPQGTPPYMSPEQELGDVSAGVDIYALAVCAYEMVAGARGDGP